MITLSKYDKIAQGLNSHYTEKAQKRMQEKAELNFNRSAEAYDQAIKSKDGKVISKVVDALISQRNELYNKIFQTGGSDADIAEYKELTAKLEKLQIHVEQLHSEGEI